MVQAWVALLRSVNVGGTGKLAMHDFAHVCEAAGCHRVATVLASGNAVFLSDATEHALRAGLERGLAAIVGRAIPVFLRGAEEIDAVLRGNPWQHAPQSQVMALFLPSPPPPSAIEAVRDRAENEFLALGRREIYLWYGSGQGQSKLRLPVAEQGTMRNMNTVAKLTTLAMDLARSA